MYACSFFQSVKLSNFPFREYHGIQETPSVQIVNKDCKDVVQLLYEVLADLYLNIFGKLNDVTVSLIDQKIVHCQNQQKLLRPLLSVVHFKQQQDEGLALAYKILASVLSDRFAMIAAAM